MKHFYMLLAAIALEVSGTTFMKFSVTHEWLIGYPVMLAVFRNARMAHRLPRNAGGHGLFVLLLKQGG